MSYVSLQVVRKKFILDNAVINYLRYILFEIGKRHCFEFDVISTNGHHYIFSLA